MSLARLINSAVKTAFNVIGDIKAAGVYYSVAPGTAYDPATDSFTHIETQYAFTDAVLTAPTQREIEWFPASQAITGKFVINAAQVPIADADDDNLRDYIVLTTGAAFTVHRVKNVPGSSILIAYVHRKDPS